MDIMDDAGDAEVAVISGRGRVLYAEFTATAEAGVIAFTAE